MAFECNIDSRGKRARLLYGIFMVLLAVVVGVFWGWRHGSVWGWVVAVLCLLGGLFAIFEARKGWCAVRAMGLKTPM